jgi:hypothetical protein
MAARLRPRHQDEVRAKIQSSVLIKLLADNAAGKLPNELSTGRIQSAKILLDKSVSNAPTEIVGQVDSNITVNIVKFADSPPK